MVKLTVSITISFSRILSMGVSGFLLGEKVFLKKSLDGECALTYIGGEHTLTLKTMSETLTEKQQAVLDFIEEYQLNFGKSPTIREMREHFQVSSDNSILKHLKALTEKGYIEKDDTPRGIKLLSAVKDKLSGAMDSVKLPVFGFIPAGGPVASEEYIDSYMNVGSDLAANPVDFFILRVTGNSMIDDGIFADDMVLVDRSRTAKDRDIVVALVDNENTLKRYMKEGSNVYLKAENKDYDDSYPDNDLQVQGVVTSLIRQY